MRARFTTRKAGSCGRKGAVCGRKAVGLLRRRVGMEAQRGCLTHEMSAVFTPPHGVSAWLMRHTVGKMAVVLFLIVIVFRCFAICFRCAHARFPGVSVAVLRSFAAWFFTLSSIDCRLQIYGFVTLSPNKFGYILRFFVRNGTFPLLFEQKYKYKGAVTAYFCRQKRY